MKFFVFLFFSLITTVCFSQKSYRVTYKRNDAYLSFTINGSKQKYSFPDYVVQYNDSLSFFHIGKLPAGTIKEFGKDVYHHHGIYYHNGTGTCYDGALVGKGKKQKKYFIIDPLKERKWITWESTKTILGYECKPMLSISETNDSLLVWYAPNIPLPYGPSKYIEFDGLVMEVYDQRSNLRWLATKIEEVPLPSFLPSDGIIVTKEEFARLKK